MIRRFMDILRESTDEFSTKGHANVKIRPNDARFGDNPMAMDGDGAATEDSTELDEFDNSTFRSASSLDKLHDILQGAHISDQEIITHGINPTDAGMHKLAAAMGVGPHEVEIMLAALTQRLREETSTVEESYRRFVKDTEAAQAPDPFDEAADGDDDGAHLSAETDFLDNVTVRSSRKSGEKYYQGSEAADITDQLKAAGNDEEARQKVIRPLIREDDAPAKKADSGFEAEIHSDSGSYNFPWQANGHSGFGTVMYNTSGKEPKIKLVSVRNGAGDNVPVDAKMHKDLLAQARHFMNDA